MTAREENTLQTPSSPPSAPAQGGQPGVHREYKVHLEAFDGPLDLLLHLIRKNEVEITDIPIATIASQYIAFLEGTTRIDIDTAGEFLVMAATLMEIKSRMLQPTPPPGDTSGNEAEPRDGVDPRAELVRQLLEYKKFRDAAGGLETRLDLWEKRYPAAAAGTDAEALGTGEVELEDLELIDLVDAFRRISESINFDRLGEHEVLSDDTPIELHAEDVLDQLRTRADESDQDTPLVSLFAGRHRVEMIGLFLAVLELVRQRRVRVRQDEGEILLALRDGAEMPPE